MGRGTDSLILNKVLAQHLMIHNFNKDITVNIDTSPVNYKATV